MHCCYFVLFVCWFFFLVVFVPYSFFFSFSLHSGSLVPNLVNPLCSARFSSFALRTFCKFVDSMPCELSTFILNCILPAALYGMESHRNPHYAHQFNGILQHQPYDAQMLIYSKEVIEKGKIIERSAHTHTLSC